MQHETGYINCMCKHEKTTYEMYVHTRCMDSAGALATNVDEDDTSKNNYLLLYDIHLYNTSI